MFQEFRIPLWERRHWPVLLDGENIVWSRRFGPAAGIAPENGTRRVLEIRESKAAFGASMEVRAGAEEVTREF
jgi:hypothetical protein